jgi:hypothetical protein
MAWAVLWSISIEESFYVEYPLVAFLLRREWLLVCLLLTVIAYGPLFARSNTNGLFSYFGCFDLLDMGALAAIAARRLQDRTPPRAVSYIKIAGAAIALSTYLLLNVREHFAIGPSMVALGGSLMLFSSQLERPPSTQRSRKHSILGSIGDASYEIHLFHAAIFLAPDAGPSANERDFLLCHSRGVLGHGLRNLRADRRKLFYAAEQSDQIEVLTAVYGIVTGAAGVCPNAIAVAYL